MALDNRGTLSRQGVMQQVSNALVEDVFVGNNGTGFILISYTAFTPGGVPFIDLIRLNISRNTRILNLAGRSACLCTIRRGMWINALFSSRMTNSIPPQANAFLVVVRRGPRPSYHATVQRIVSIDTFNNTILTADPEDFTRQIQFNITNRTIIRNRFGNLIGISELRRGQLVRILHANYQTGSIPPQTTSFSIQVL